MKTINNYLLLFLIGCTFYSCQKELSPEPITAAQSTGSLAKDASGNCLPVNVNGIYKKDSVLNATHYIDVSVNVTAAGSYLIKTDTTNGIYFKDSAAFTATGLQTVRLKGYGTPLATGITSLTVQFNGSSSCAVQLMVTAAGSSVATFTLAGAPGSCTSPTILGAYTAGTALNATNKIQLNVIVTAVGDYSISTNSVNGISFSATGTFITATPQTVTLSATGTPVTATPTTLSVSGAPAGCSFTININSGTSSGTQFIAAILLDTTLVAPFDTVGRFLVTYDVQNRPVVKTEISYKPNGDTLYYSQLSFQYNGNDSFVNKTTEYRKDLHGSIPTETTEVTFYSFSNGRMIKDSSLILNNYAATDFTYNGTTIQRNERRFFQGTPALYLFNTTVYQTFVNGNNTYQIDTLIGHSANNNNPATYNYTKTEITTSYISNPNPFYQLYKHIQQSYYSEEMGITTKFAPKNLMTRQIEHAVSWSPTSSGDNLNQVDYIYNFRPDGYPVIAWSTFDNIGMISKQKILFFYR